MIKLHRSDAPTWLTQNWKQWGLEYREKKQADPMALSHEGKQVRSHLIKPLVAMTKKHCSFCDSTPLGSQIRATIEHFRPKESYPHLAYQWENLFACCDICQTAKWKKFDEALLKPDEIEYEFKRYFFFEETTGKLIPNQGANTEDQNRALLTIQIYKLNEFERPEARLWALELARQIQTLPVDKLPYRFMFL